MSQTITELKEKKFLDNEGVKTLWENIKAIIPEEGLDGKSAYEIAKELGFEGSEEEWIKSLQGESGVYVGTEEPTEDIKVWINPEGRIFNETVTSVNGQTGDIVGLATEEYVDEAVANVSGGSSPVAEETVLASGTLTSETTAQTFTPTGITLGDLRKWKMWGVAFNTTGGSPAFKLMICRNGVSKYAMEYIHVARAMVRYIWVNEEKTVYDTIFTNNTNVTIAETRRFIGDISYASSILGSFLHTVPCSHGSVMGFLQNLTDTDEIYIYNHTAPTADFNWVIKGVLK